MNPVREIAAMVRAKYPDVLILVDAVSSMAGVEIRFDEWGLDVCLAGVQKCFALPPGLAVCAVSSRAMARAKTIPYRGYYFDFHREREVRSEEQHAGHAEASAIFLP